MPNYDAYRAALGDSRSGGSSSSDVLRGLYDLFTSLIPSKKQPVDSRNQTKSTDRQELDSLTIDFFEKIDQHAFYTAFTVVAKRNNVNLEVVGVVC
ncbi:MAG: hypothetical protein RLZZ511_3051 [Cyanobacteriota bacterium]|jgi:hypothetical protein